MLGFRKKGVLRKEEEATLYEMLERQKESIDYQKKLLAHSVDPSEELLNQLKRAEALYSLLLREARVRHRRKQKGS